MAGRYIPSRGDVVWVTLNPQAGHEQAGRRPALVVSPLAYNRKVGLAILCPITNQVKGYPFEAVIPPGSEITGAILSDQVRCLDWRERQAELICRLPKETVVEAMAKLHTLLDPDETKQSAAAAGPRQGERDRREAGARWRAMAAKLRIYLDTSVISALLDQRDVARWELTNSFWAQLESYQPHICPVVLDEIARTPDPDRRRKMSELIRAFSVIPWSHEVDRLATRYLAAGAFAPAMQQDAKHVAACTVAGIPVLLNWNFRHLVNRTRRMRVNLVNSEEGYGQIPNSRQPSTGSLNRFLVWQGTSAYSDLRPLYRTLRSPREA